MVAPLEAGGRGMDAQWDDDVHHALHALLTGERRAYYVDFGSLEVVAKVLTSAFLHDGTFSTFRGHVHGRHVDRAITPGHRFVACLQNHDQIGNREAGERITALTSLALAQIGAVLVLTSAFTPMLFMGEEWAASTPWPYFTSHPQPELAARADQRRARRVRVAGAGTPSRQISPQDPAAFYGAKLKWDELDDRPHAATLALYRSLIALRHAEPELADPRLDQVEVPYDEDAAGWSCTAVRCGSWSTWATEPVTVPVATGEILLATGPVDSAVDWLVLGPQTARDRPRPLGRPAAAAGPRDRSRGPGIAPADGRRPGAPT